MDDAAFHELYAFGAFRLDAVRRTLTGDGSRIALTPTVFDVLLCLVRNAGVLVTKDMLIDAVWGRRIVGDSTLSQTVFTLRRALAAAGHTESLIVTAPGRGYRLAADVRRVVSDSEESSAALPGAAVILSRRWPLQRFYALAALVCAAACAAVLAWRFWPAPAASGPPVVLVQAQFENSTGEPAFDRSLETVIAADLDQSPRLRVLSPEQVRAALWQMLRPADSDVGPSLAREVCLRSGAQAVIQGALARIGRRYLVTLMTTGCADGAAVASEKGVADSREAVVGAVDSLVAASRRKLGEPEASLRRYDAPLIQGRTASLEALRAYSQGVRDQDAGRVREAGAEFDQAVSLDPQFAAAWLDKARLDFNTGRYQESREAISRAYALRERVGQDTRFSIEIVYNLVVPLDYVQALSLAQAATRLYPDHWIGWSQQANLNIQFGRYDEAVTAARHALALAPGRESGYVQLGEALTGQGRFAEALAVCRAAQARGVAGGMIAGLEANLAAARDAPQDLQRILAAAGDRPWEPDVLATAALDAYRHGQVNRGDALFARAAALHAAAGTLDYYRGERALDLALAGDAPAAQALVTPLPPEVHPMSLSLVDTIFTLAELGQAPRASQLLAATMRNGPTDTTLRAEFAPEARASMALAAGKPRQALAELEPARIYEDRDVTAPFLRARIELALGDGAAAAADFRKVIAASGLDPADIRHALAWLGLARAQRAQGRLAEARVAYGRFFSQWAGADPDVPVLQAARREAAQLGGQAG
jgi:DNA-binding winged helix-turn-helix (wHTH) protein/tetratricopeptide (TPR) repeat protein